MAILTFHYRTCIYADNQSLAGTLGLAENIAPTLIKIGIIARKAVK